MMNKKDFFSVARILIAGFIAVTVLLLGIASSKTETVIGTILMPTKVFTQTLASVTKIGNVGTLETDKINILESRIVDMDVVQYAYKSKIIPIAKNEISRTSNSRTFFTGKRMVNGKEMNVYLAEIFSGQAQYYQEGNIWYQLEYATATKAVYDAQTITLWDRVLRTVFAATTSTFSGGSDGYAATLVDGSFNVMHDAVGDNNAGTTAESSAMCGNITTTATTDVWDTITRGNLAFNTTVIGNTNEAVSSTLVITSNGDGSANDFSQGVEIVSKANFGTALQNSDYASSTFGTVSFGTFDITPATWGTDKANWVALNQDGLDFITTKIQNSTSTSLGLRITADKTGTSPSWAGSQVSRAGCYMSEQTGTADDPTLYIEYQVPSPGVTEVKSCILGIGITRGCTNR